MEYPGRILDMGNYAYQRSDTIDAQQVKPQAVAEAEFKLTDDLFTLSKEKFNHHCQILTSTS